ncbi:uncharacterized protein KGF55_005226 [Candida pseudojiufengensis]|uniref:uncharacterized protein n=1 Tax=Candida pseudojiufengensis TaxID=497109 RepID=UPI0022249768|nr:uncharacterized protein KGF55_005226 [Candida pseudojiufengensis]KAI5959582.1 hypothetical protein KGF55_005226 [Candida pseudojiufengensis]
MTTSATTTTTKKKKKLVYKQDSDGVFRLKKDTDNLDNTNNNDNSSITTNEIIDKKRKVDNYLNELMDCSYTIMDDLSNNNQQQQDDKDRPNYGGTRSKSLSYLNNKNKNLVVGEKDKQKKLINRTSSINTNNKTSTSLRDTELARTSSDTTNNKTKSSSPPSKSPPKVKSKSKQSKTQKNSFFKNLIKFPNFSNLLPKFPNLQPTMSQIKQTSSNLLKFHIPSFLLGIILTIISVIFRKQLILLTIGLIVIGIVLLILSTGGIILALKIGFLKQQDIAIVDQIITFMQLKFNLFKPKEIEESEEEEEEEPIDQTSEVESNIIQNYMREDNNSFHTKRPTPPSQPKIKERRQSNIRVTPFRYERENTTNSVPNINNYTKSFEYQQQEPNQLKRLNTEPIQLKKRNSPPSSKFKSKINSSSNIPIQKKLPITPQSLNNDELPFINEVKLVDSLEQQENNDQDSYSHHPNQLRNGKPRPSREYEYFQDYNNNGQNQDEFYINDEFENDSIYTSNNNKNNINNGNFNSNGHSTGNHTDFMRQQSILGTRANYKKFLANVDH